MSACDGIEEWRALNHGVSAWFAAPSHTAGAALVGRIAEQAGGPDRLPDMDLRAGGVRVRVGTPGSGPTDADLAVAADISAAARDLGLTPDPSALQVLRLTVDALDKPAVMPFWRTALGYLPLGDDNLLDPARRDPPIRFQQQDRPRPLRNRIHVDIARPYALIVRDLPALRAAGRERYADEHHATLADAEGNEADIIPLAPADMLGDDPDTADWRALFGAMVCYPTDSPVRAAELAAAVASLADDAGLQMLVDLRGGGVTVDTGKDQWEHDRFADLARRIQAAARGMGLTADATPLRFVQAGIDAVDIPPVRQFWRAVLGYEYDPRPQVTDIYDPRRLNPPIFFQRMPESEQARRRQRNRIHLDLFVPRDQARARIDAGLAAGGRLVSDGHAPAWWTLADPEGNEIDIAVAE